AAKDDEPGPLVFHDLLQYHRGRAEKDVERTAEKLARLMAHDIELQLLHVHHLRIGAHCDEGGPGIAHRMDYVARDVREAGEPLSDHGGALGFGRKINSHYDGTPSHCRLLARVRLQHGP